MALDKKTLNDFLPNGFETQNKTDYKANFSNDKIAVGFDKDTLEVLSGPNLNNLLDKTGKNFHTLNDFLNYFNQMPIGSFPIVNTSNQLDYKSINSFFRNVGEIVPSLVPLDDDNLRLLDGSLLENNITYSRFISFIAGLRSTLPNLFTTEANWQSQVQQYGVCGKFVYNTTDKSLRLPKITGIIQGTNDSGSLGDLVEAGLPDHNHYLTINRDRAGGEGNAVYGDEYYYGINNQYSSNASQSNPIYGNSTTVQPQTIKVLYYIVVSIDEAEKQVLSAVYNYKGSVATYADLPNDAAIGEVYNVIGEDPEGYSGANFAWTGEEWDRLGGTVNLTGYLTKTEASNTYATKASLESNVDNLQNQINTNATNIANIASQEVIDAGIQKIEALKFASTIGHGITNDTDLYNVIKKYAHSSFDRSKFAVTGSPTITSDGIASGFSGSNYVDTIKLLPDRKSWVVTLRYIFATSTNDYDYLIYNSAGDSGLVSTIKPDGVTLNVMDEGGGSPANITVSGTSFANGDVLDITYSYDATEQKYSLVVYNNGVLYGSQTSAQTSVIVKQTSTGFMRLGVRQGGTRYVRGSIDLKYYTVRYAKELIFNSNLTGLDVIKDDDYTTTGTPTISSDGVATFSGSSSVDTLLNLSGDTLKVVIPFNTSDLAAKNLLASTSGYVRCDIMTTGGKYLPRFQFLDGVNSHYIRTATNGLVADTDYIVVGEYNKTTNYATITLYSGGTVVETVTNQPSNTITIPNSSQAYNLGSNATNLKIDLNGVKFYVNGDLLCQPCLKIPYTLSNTDLKITRNMDRAIDMANQCGFSDYFGLNEQNNTCMTPLGDNISGRRTLVRRTEDSVTHYVIEIYSDLFCRQSGSGTASTALTFAIPYKDDDTVKVSCPYSAKSKTGFTPTANCDWFAEGYIYLDEVI